MLQSKSLRDIALQMNKLYELYVKVHQQAFLAKQTKLVVLVPLSGIALLVRRP
jgi:hypothetical protein